MRQLSLNGSHLRGSVIRYVSWVDTHLRCIRVRIRVLSYEVILPIIRHYPLYLYTVNEIIEKLSTFLPILFS